MKHLKYLAFVAFAGLCSAAPVTFNNVSVTCKEISHPLFTSNLTVTVDSAVNGGTISAGTSGADNCFFSLAGNVLSQPFIDNTYNYSSAQDTVCWAVGFCNGGSTPDSITIATVAGGKSFTVLSSSITTTFTLPTAAPEPGSMVLMGSALLSLVGLARLRRSRAGEVKSLGSSS